MSVPGFNTEHRIMRYVDGRNGMYTYFIANISRYISVS